MEAEEGKEEWHSASITGRQRLTRLKLKNIREERKDLEKMREVEKGRGRQDRNGKEEQGDKEQEKEIEKRNRNRKQVTEDLEEIKTGGKKEEDDEDEKGPGSRPEK